MKYFSLSESKARGGWGNKTGPIDYQGQPVSPLGGEFCKQDSYTNKGDP